MISNCFLWEWMEKLLILFITALLARGSSCLGCPPSCICASDLLSCVKQGLHQVPPFLPPTSVSLDLSHNNLSHLHNHWLSGLPRLHIVRLSHNHIRRLPAKAFHNATLLRHLDLSSNRLERIKEELFENLWSLEELLLYNNRIVHVDEGAFSRMGNIYKIYLSWNLLTVFSFSSMQNLTNPHLRTLDLSSNRFLELPVEEVSSLPSFIKNGLYLHNNPLTCHCALYALFSHWDQRGFSSVVDFYKEHTCLYMGQHRAIVRILQPLNGFDNCSLGPWYRLPDADIRVLIGKRLMVACNTSLPQENTTYLWISPTYEFIISPGNNNQSIKIHRNGSLEILKAQTWNSGIYLCIAVNRKLNYNSTHEVNITVHYPKHEAESFNTGLTTLLGCVVSLVLVFVYLYMTPCRCLACCSKPAQTPSPPHEGSAQSSILCGTPPTSEGHNNRKAGASRHVVFLEPIKEGRADKNLKILHLKSDSDSASSVFSDSPIVPT
ncbi:amphoterin-induced protein 3 [Bombina bombina]|uniref:amphoterin-induced protein 3 n=1 Tax=Bombina bombina TaxID=8345 RepID=UPI00235A87F1|nr:amphoterin-induced protein 3 [Bombina bombina]